MTVIGAVLLGGARRSQIPPEARGLAAGSAAALAAIDVVYVAKRRIAPTYLLDASAQMVLLGGLISAKVQRK